jgi:hypothetical protein
MIGAVSTCHYGFKTHTEVNFPHGTKQQVFKFCAHEHYHSPLFCRSVTKHSDNGDSGAESVLCAAICEAFFL